MDAGALIARECLVSASQEAILAAVPGFCDSDAESGHQLYDLTPRQVPEDSILPIDPSGNVFLGTPPVEIGIEEAASGTGTDVELGQSQQFSASLGNIDGMGTQVWSMSMASLHTPGSLGKEVNSSAAIAMDDDPAGCSSPAFNRTSRTTKPSDEGEQSEGETRLTLELPLPAGPGRTKSSDSAPNAEASPSLEQRFLSANDGGSPKQHTGTPASVCSAKSRVAEAGTGSGSAQRVSGSPPLLTAATIDVPRQESCVVVTPLAVIPPEDAAPGFQTPINGPNVEDDHEDLEMRRVLSNPNHVSTKRLLSTICLRLNKSLPDKRRRVEEEDLLSSGRRQRLREETSCQLEHLYGAAGTEAATKLSSPSFVQAFEAASGPRRTACEDHGFAEFSAALKRRCYRLPPFT